LHFWVVDRATGGSWDLDILGGGSLRLVGGGQRRVTAVLCSQGRTQPVALAVCNGSFFST